MAGGPAILGAQNDQTRRIPVSLRNGSGSNRRIRKVVEDWSCRNRASSIERKVFAGRR